MGEPNRPCLSPGWPGVGCEQILSEQSVRDVRRASPGV